MNKMYVISLVKFRTEKHSSDLKVSDCRFQIQDNTCIYRILIAKNKNNNKTNKKKKKKTILWVTFFNFGIGLSTV